MQTKLIILCIASIDVSLASSIYPPIESITGAPARHAYRSIDYGTSSINGQRIQIRTDAPGGPAVTTSQLNINNAGVQAGYIAPNSGYLEPGTSCDSTQMGMMAQQLTTDTSPFTMINSQLQCMYNPTFCSSNGYCYLPIKTSKFLYQYEFLQYTGQCPSGTIVDINQPTDGVITSVTCPSQSGWTLTQAAHGVGVNCYTGATGMSFCTSYQTVCSYSNESGNTQQIAVTALKQLQCTNASTTYIVNNYTP